MAKEDKDIEDVTKGNWNIAGSYTREKILKWLIQIDYFQTISTFGYSNIESDVFIRDDNLKNASRLYGLRRLIHSLLSLIRNTKFAVKKDDRTSFGEYSERLLKIEKHLFRLRLEKKRGQRTVELNIEEKLFDKIMEEITTMVDNINYKLNLAGLIFTPEEEFDIKEIKQGYKEKFINRT